MPGTEELSRIIFDDRAGISKRLAAVEQLAIEPERATFEVLLRSMLHSDGRVRRRAAEVLGQVILSLIETAREGRLNTSDDVYNLLSAAAYYILAAIVSLSRRDRDPSAFERATFALSQIAEKLSRVLEEDPRKLRLETTRINLKQAATESGAGWSSGALETGRGPSFEPESLPDPARLTRPASVFLSGPLEMASGDAARLVAGLCGVPALEVQRTLVQTRGIVAREVRPEQVPEIIEALRRHGQAAFAVEWSKCWLPPEAVKALSFSVTPEGFEAKVQFPDRQETYRESWGAVFLIAGARVFRETTKVVQVRRRRLIRSVLVEQTVPTVEDVYIVDLILKHPWRRVRIGEPLPDLSALGLKIVGGGEVDARKAAAEIVGAARGVLMNEGVRLLAAPDSDLSLVTFSGKHHLEHYEVWLLQLARFGLIKGQES